MRCKACNVELDDYESTRKDENGEFYDLCNSCYASVIESLLEFEEELTDYPQRDIDINDKI